MWCSLGQCGVSELHHRGGVVGQTPFYLLIEYSSWLNEWRMHWFMNNISLQNVSECACFICVFVRVHVCAYNVKKTICTRHMCVCFIFFFCGYVSAWIPGSPACRACAAALTFPDESRCACPLVLTLPHTIKACWTTSVTHSHFPLALTSLPLHSAICCQLNL